MRQATTTDIPAIYGLLEAVHFPHLPEYEEAKQGLIDSHSLVIEREGKIVGWVNIHLHSKGRLGFDVAIAFEWQGKLITKGLCKQVLTYCLKMGDCIVVDSYTARAAKLALLMGFKLAPDTEAGPFVRLQLTKEYLNG
jgi:N-acetylglutamate synthase-like GNAT family acetyltransferase